jgi:hypothetical protein
VNALAIGQVELEDTAQDYLFSGGRDGEIFGWNLPLQTRDEGELAGVHPLTTNLNPDPTTLTHLNSSISFSGHLDWVNALLAPYPNSGT